MKVLDLDPSHENRVSLAKELGYDGDFDDSATMNIWLHKHVHGEPRLLIAPDPFVTNLLTSGPAGL